MKRPILIALVFIIGGILIGSYADMRMGFFFALGLAFLCFCLYKAYQYVPVFIFLLFALVGFCRVQSSLYEPLIPASPAAFTGVVQEKGLTASGNTRIVIKNDTKKIMAYLKPGMDAQVGQVVTVTGNLRLLEKPKYPGAYNELVTLRIKKIDSKMFPDEIYHGAIENSPGLWLHALNERIKNVYNAVLPPKEAAVVRSVVMGEKGGLDDDIAYLYRLAGIYHILSISGLHVAILMLAVKRLLGVFIPERQAAVAALIVMVFYCLLTGAAVSTVRALTMCGLGIGAKIWFREYDLLASTAFACIALLIYEPLYLFNVGFQLSFSAVFGIAILTAPLERLLTLIRFPFRKQSNTVAVGIAAVLATYPALSFHFHEIAAYSVLVNLIIVPTVMVLVIMGTLVGVIGLVSLPAAMFLSGVLFYLLRFYEMVCSFFAALPFAVIRTGSCGLAVVAAAYGLMFLFVYTFTSQGSIKPKMMYLSAGAMVLIVCIFLRAYPTGWELMVLDDVSVLRHKRQVVVVGETDSFALGRYLSYLGIDPSGYFHNDVVFSIESTTVGFYTEETADIQIISGQRYFHDLPAHTYIINSGNPWARAAAVSNLKNEGKLVYDTAVDGGIRILFDKNRIKIFAKYL